MIHNRQTKTLEIQDSIAKTDKHFIDYHTNEHIYVGENIYICTSALQLKNNYAVVLLLLIIVYVVS
jgi:hypothetical protein